MCWRTKAGERRNSSIEVSTIDALNYKLAPHSKGFVLNEFAEPLGFRKSILRAVLECCECAWGFFDASAAKAARRLPPPDERTVWQKMSAIWKEMRSG